MSYNTSNYQDQGGATWTVAGTQVISGVQTISGTATVSGLINVTGTFQQAGTAVRVYGGTASLGTVGSAVVTSGFTTVIGASANVHTNATPGTLAALVTASIGSNGTVTFYGWKPTNSSTTTLVASAEATTISYTIVGT